MFAILFKSLISGVLILLSYRFCQANLSNESQNFEEYREAVRIMQKWLASTVDVTQHHFQPCRVCGYELALRHDNQYCEKSDQFKLMHPEVVLNDSYIFRDYGGPDLARKIIASTMYDVLPSFAQNRPVNYSYYELPLETSVIYPYAKNYFRTHPIGRQAGCMFQKYFHVPGQEELAQKSNQSTHYHNYKDNLKQEGKSEQCLKDASYEKPTFRMWNQEDCIQFFNTVNSEEYQQDLQQNGIVYIFKTNRHLGNGILLVDSQNEQQIRDWYQNGNQCGRNDSQVIIQEYLRNPYLFKGHKMEFRSYFQIASTNPHILYGYRRALIKQCALKFDLKDFTKETHVCNTAVTKTHKVQTNQNDDDDLYIDWNLEELQEMLLEQGRINSTNWLQEHLYPQMMRKITHLYFSVDQYMFVDSRVGEFFGVDFIMDDDLNVWIFECNRNPNFLAVTEGRKEKFGKLIPNMLEIQLQLVRSRYKRIQRFLKEKLLTAIKNKKIKFEHNKKDENTPLKQEFLQLMKDRLEPEYQLSSDNLALLAYVGDKQLAQEMNFLPYISKECLQNKRQKL